MLFYNIIVFLKDVTDRANVLSAVCLKAVEKEERKTAHSNFSLWCQTFLQQRQREDFGVSSGRPFLRILHR